MGPRAVGVVYLQIGPFCSYEGKLREGGDERDSLEVVDVEAWSDQNVNALFELRDCDGIVDRGGRLGGKGGLGRCHGGGK